MKKVILSAFVLVMFVTVSHAQGIRLGVKAGANLNKISGQSFNDGFDLSYHAGGFMEIDLNKSWGIQPELLWSQTTGKPTNFKTVYATSSFNTTLDASKNIKLDYLSIPVLLRVNVTGMFSLLAGPQYSILINKDNTLLQNGKSAFKSGDFAMVAGAQINLKMLRIYGRYNIGLQNINDIDQKDKWTNQQMQLGLGFRL
jgi:hypothetical protein